MKAQIQANYEERLSRYAALLHGNEPPGLVAKLAVYQQLLRQRDIHGDRLWQIEPILYPLAEQDVIALVNSVIKVVTDQEWKLRDGASFHVGEFYAIGVENMRALLVGANAAGGVVGKMISPQSLTIAATAIGIAGAESIILRRIIGWSFVLLALLCLLSGLMSTPVLSWLLP